MHKKELIGLKYFSFGKFEVLGKAGKDFTL
jgi:hypothetical protein